MSFLKGTSSCDHYYSKLNPHVSTSFTGDNTIDHITQVLVQILCLNCYQFGRALNLSDSEISHIASKCGMNNQESMRAILSKWSHKNNNNVSWRAVVQALRDSDQPRLADMITMCYIDTPETMDITETIPLQGELNIVTSLKGTTENKTHVYYSSVYDISLITKIVIILIKVYNNHFEPSMREKHCEQNITNVFFIIKIIILLQLPNLLYYFSFILKYHQFL